HALFDQEVAHSCREKVEDLGDDFVRLLDDAGVSIRRGLEELPQPDGGAMRQLDSDDAQRLAPQGVGIGRACGHKANAEAAYDGVGLVGEAHQDAWQGLGKLVAGVPGKIMLKDSLGYAGVLTRTQ